MSLLKDELTESEVQDYRLVVTWAQFVGISMEIKDLWCVHENLPCGS